MAYVICYGICRVIIIILLAFAIAKFMSNLVCEKKNNPNTNLVCENRNNPNTLNKKHAKNNSDKNSALRQKVISSG